MRRIDRNSAEMPFLDHLEELRWRIIWSALAVVASMALGCYVVLHYDVISLLEKPILPYLNGHHLVATHPTDGLQITISAAMWFGLVLSFPVVLYQAWLFFSPALYKREKRLLTAALAGGVLLFAGGACFAYFVILPISIPFLIGMMGTALDPMITGENYFGFLFSTVVSFGVAFELPVVVLLLSAAGLVTPQLLSKFRRHAFIFILVASAFLTPGDYVMGTMAMSVPLYLLYELSVLVARIIWRHRNSGDAPVIILLAPLLLFGNRRKLRTA
ncbi:MAG: twin-arginine translocase subunit TatC [Gemmatimonadaceae bacterium]